MKYRPEIDGLRAMAVIPVILFHAGFKVFSGGFVGVDIFFVISGYLITTNIVVEMEQGTFSLLNFYEKRARRILPALFFVMLCSLPFAWFLMLPIHLKEFSQSLFFVPIFLSNVLFYKTSGYFDMVSELKPLLHTWSLAVEEQYYVLFPLFLMLTWQLGKKWITCLLVIVTIISLSVASIYHSTFTFYSLPTRGWEILTGALISLFINNKSSKTLILSPSVHQSISFLGLILILYAIFSFDNKTPAPSLYTLIPTIGAGLLLVFANDKTLVGRLLGRKLFVGIGMISYSAYLWHQPIIAFSKLRSLIVFSTTPPILVLTISLILAYFSYRFIEKPFRNKIIISSKTIFISSFIGTIIFLLLGSIGYLENGFKNQLYSVPNNLVWLTFGEKLRTNGDICNPVPLEKTGISTCNFGDLRSSKNIVLYGDSHSQAISYELNKALIELNIKGTKISINGCDGIPEIATYSYNTDMRESCLIGFNDMLSHIKNSNAAVIVAIRWSFRLYPIKDEIMDMPYKNSEGGIENDAEYREYVSVINGNISFSGVDKKKAVNNFIEGLLASTNNLYLIYPIPEIGWDVARTNMSYYRKYSALLDEISIPYIDYKNRNRFINSVFNEYQSNKKIIPIKPELIFCDTFIKNRCAAQYKTIHYYYDDDHLSDIGSKLIIDKIKEKIITDTSKLDYITP